MTDTLDDNPGAGSVLTLAALDAVLRKAGMAEADRARVQEILRAGQAAEITHAGGERLRLVPAGTGLCRSMAWVPE